MSAECKHEKGCEYGQDEFVLVLEWILLGQK